MDNERSVYEINESDKLLKLIEEIINKNELKALRTLLRNNPYCIQFKPKELNKLFKIEGYKFTKRNNNIILIVNKNDTVNDKCEKVLNDIMKDLTL